MMWGQTRASRAVTGVDTPMIAGVRACLTFAPGPSSWPIQTTPHYAEALLGSRGDADDWEATRKRYFALNWIRAAATWTAFTVFPAALVAL